MDMKKSRFILIIILIAVILLTGVFCLAAYTPEYKDEADALKALGLFAGTDKGYELDRAPTRTEALVMLIRLLGKEAEAKVCKYKHPFTDVPDWADRYVAWAYAKGLTKGKTETLFDSKSGASARMFLTFVLRALGYDDASGDFTYEKAADKAAEIGLIAKGEYKSASSGFLRDDCVYICFKALTRTLKSGGITLAEKLVSSGAIKKETAVKYGIFSEPKSYLVACVGDSFTAGYGLDDPDTQAFPAVLATLKGDYSFTTENYGYAGLAVNNESKLSYLDSKTGGKSFKTAADIVLITLGANDAVWSPDMSDFDEDYKYILEKFIGLPGKPRVVVVLPPRLLGLEGYDETMAGIVAIELNVAKKMKLDIIDLYTYSEDMDEYVSSDGVHFNAEGHELIAEYIYDELAGILSE